MLPPPSLADTVLCSSEHYLLVREIRLKAMLSSVSSGWDSKQSVATLLSSRATFSGKGGGCHRCYSEQVSAKRCSSCASFRGTQLKNLLSQSAELGRLMLQRRKKLPPYFLLRATTRFAGRNLSSVLMKRVRFSDGGNFLLPSFFPSVRPS